MSSRRSSIASALSGRRSSLASSSESVRRSSMSSTESSRRSSLSSSSSSVEADVDSDRLVSTTERFEKAINVFTSNHTMNYYYGSALSKVLRMKPSTRAFNAHEVYPNVYVGDVYAAHNLEELKKKEFTHIVTCVLGVTPAYPENFKYLHIPLLDCAAQNIHEHFQKTTEFIQAALADGGKVLIHCLQGVSRSATIAAAFVMSTLQCTPKEAVTILQQNRTVIRPNYGFMMQLEWYYANIVSQESARTAEPLPRLRSASVCF